mgnify:CR=1 FL=1
MLTFLEFLEEGKKVQIVMKFRPRELMNKDIGLEKFNNVIQNCKDISEAEYGPKFDGNKFTPIDNSVSKYEHPYEMLAYEMSNYVDKKEI